MSDLTRRKFITASAVAGGSLAGSSALGQVITVLPEPGVEAVRNIPAQPGAEVQASTEFVPTTETPAEAPFFEPDAVSVDRNISSFRTHKWQTFFGSVGSGAILVDTKTRSLHYWQTPEEYFIYPTSVPMSPELTRLGRTKVVAKVEGPEWRPTPNMLKRDPSLPTYVGPGPQNPLGTHALYLSWKYYRIHGTNDTRKIGRMSSNGCIGLFNEDIKVLFDMTKVGTQVLLI